MAGSEVTVRTDRPPPPLPPRISVPSGRLEDGLVWAVIVLLDSSRLLPRIAKWKEEERSGPGGRPETFPTRALLAAMLLAAVTNQPMLATTFTDVLFRQISPTMRHALGVPKPPAAKDQKGRKNRYRNVRTRFHGLLGLMDPSPMPKNRRFDPETFEMLTELRRSGRSPEEWTTREDRLTWFINEILEMSIRTLPRDVRRKWKGSVAVDATVIPAFARPSRREPRKRKGVSPTTRRYSSDPDADWYHRDKRDNAGDDGDPKKSVWGYEATFAVSGSDDPSQSAAIPSLAMGMAVLHKPGHEVGQNAIRALTSIVDRGHLANYLAGDRAYTQAKPENFQLPARALGYLPVLDYKIDQLGLQGSEQGMIQVDGSWYCPGMPESLINATLDFRKKKIDGATHRARIEERRRHQIRPKAGPDKEGHVRMRCPAANPGPVVRCELKPSSEGKADHAKIRIPVTDALRLRPSKICAQSSITLPPESGAKYSQVLAHETEEWHATFATLRNSIEGMNGFIKDGGKESVDDPERRRIRGVAAQSVLVACQLSGANLRKIEQFLVSLEGKVRKFRKRTRRRRTSPLSDWGPDTPNADTGDPTGDPDPPLTA